MMMMMIIVIVIIIINKSVKAQEKAFHKSL